MSGGYGALTSVEVFVPSTGQSCFFPPLPDERYLHTMDSLYICGGQYTPTCVHFSAGQWTTSYTLVGERYYHSSWQTELGLVLLGGEYSLYTSEIVPTAGGQGCPAFDMKYATT